MFISLEDLINFIEVDLIRPQPFSDEQLQAFATHFLINDAIVELTQRLYHAESDDSLDDDIYKQNPMRSRSITELVSNALDAKASCVKVSIQTGEYAVCDDGVGMTAVQIFRQLLPPKISGKEGSVDDIGRFGLGYYTALAHLDTDDDRVILQTRAANDSGYQLTFRKIDGKIHINMQGAPDFSTIGTHIYIQSKDIKEQEYSLQLAENLRFHTRTPIFVNDQLLNNYYTTVYQPISKSSLFIDADNVQKMAVITVGGVTIQKTSTQSTDHACLVVWELPKTVTLSEGRSQIRVDSERVRQECRALIDAGLSLSMPLKAQYFNTIAPLVEELQANNSSFLERDNLLTYLQALVSKVFEYDLQVPDQDILIPLQTPETVVLHPLIVSKDWEDKCATPARHCSSNNKVWISTMSTRPSSIGFIHDRENARVYLDSGSYQQIAARHDWWKLNLLGRYPGRELALYWSEIKEQPVVAESSAIELPVAPPTTSPYAFLFAKHGILAEYGDEFFASLSEGDRQTLFQASTLMQIYPCPQVPGNDGHFQSARVYSITPYYYQGDKFYLLNNSVLLDRNFQYSGQLKSLLLTEKAKQLKARGMTGVEIVFESSDRFLISSAGTSTGHVYDGEANCLVSKKAGECLIILNHLYYAIGTKSKTLIYHFKHGLVIEEATHSTRRMISKHHLLCKGSYPDHTERVLDLANRCQLISVVGRVKRVGSFYVLFHYGEKYDPCAESFSVRCLEITDITGKTLVQHACYLDILNLDFDALDCRVGDNRLYFSYSYFNTFMLVVIALDTGDVQYYQQNRILGFPVVGYLSGEESTQTLVFNFTSGHEKIDEIEHVVYFDNDSSTSLIDERRFYDLKGRKIRPQDRIKNRVFLITQKNDLAGQRLIIGRDGTVTALSAFFSEQVIINIESKEGFFRTSIKQNDHISQLIVNKEGHLVLSGQQIDVVTKNNVCFFLVDKTRLFNQQGQLIYEHATAFSVAIPFTQTNWLLIAGQSTVEPFRTLIDHSGKWIVTRVGQVHADGLVSFLNEQNESVVLTANARLTNVQFNSDGVIFSRLNNACEYKIYTRSGYSLFPEPVDTDPAFNLCGDLYQLWRHYNVNKLLRPLTLMQLQSSNTLNNIRYLNRQTLDFYTYGSCLRFIDWPTDGFKQLYPYMTQLNYLPALREIDDYLYAVNQIEGLQYPVRLSIMKLIDLIYSINKEGSDNRCARQLLNIINVSGHVVIEKLWTALNLRKKDLLNALTYEALRPVFNDFPKDLGQFAYYIFMPMSALLSVQSSMRMENASPSSLMTVSLVDYLTAYRLDTRILDDLTNPVDFLQGISSRIDQANQHLIRRKLMHAIYHQAHPERCLYLREMLQNALDAMVDNKSSEPSTVAFQLSVNEDQSCVLSIKDDGIGMDLREVFRNLFGIGISTKRRAEKGKFIGGRGVGMYTSFHGAKQLLLKTGKGDGNAFIFCLTPRYITLASGESQVVDVQIQWHQRQELFKGTRLERVSLANDPVLEAAMYHRAMNTHARLIDARAYEVTLNGVCVNRPLDELYQFNLPSLGDIRLYRSTEQAITAGGLFVKPLSGEFMHFLPHFIQAFFEKSGLIIDFPKSTALNRERNDFESTDKFVAFIQPWLTQAFYASYIHSFIKGLAELSELPTDFFCRFRKHQSYMFARNARVGLDAEIINSGGILENYTLYQNPQLLTDLLCHLNLIAYKINEVETKVSVVELSRLFDENMLDRSQSLPQQIIDQIDYVENNHQSRHRFFFKTPQKVESDKNAFANRAWIPSHFDQAPNWQWFTELAHKIATTLTQNDIQMGYGTVSPEALAYIMPGEKTIYWNCVLIEDKSGLSEMLTACNTPISLDQFRDVLTSMTHIISHEWVHICDKPCAGHHNRAFELRQRTVLADGLLAIDTGLLYEEYLLFFEQKIRHAQLPTAVDFMAGQLQLTSIYADESSSSLKACS